MSIHENTNDFERLRYFFLGFSYVLTNKVFVAVHLCLVLAPQFYQLMQTSGTKKVWVPRDSSHREVFDK